MKRIAAWILVLLLLWAVPTTLAADDGAPDEDQAGTLKEALAQGDTTVTLRYRVELVDQDGLDKDANASTLRTTLSYRTRAYERFSLFLEAESVTDIATDEQYNNAGAGSLNNGVRDRPVVADPEITEVNQACLRWQGERTRLDVGRQEINWGDQRFVGAVGWRQNHQSFDALSLTDQSTDKLKLTYAFLSNANRIFGDNKQMDSHLLSAKVDVPLGAVDLYGLYLDYDEARDFGLSRSTFGAEWTGSRELESGSKLLWEAEYASQSDAGDNPDDVSANYLFLMAGGVLGGVTIKGAYEVLDGSGEDGQFQTPLATLHKFNGWADKFLATPTNGLEDLYLSFAGRVGALGWMVVFHDFSAESASTDYGTELDLQLTWKAPWDQTFGLKGALYDADEHASDTDKIWLFTGYKF